MADTTIDLLKNSSYVGKMDELIAAVKLGSGATSDVEWDNVKNKPTTIGGYGIIDAKIDNGTITLGNQTITPLTSAPVTSVNSKTGAVTLSATDVSAIPSTLTGTAGQVLTKTADGQEWKDVDIPTALPNPNALTFTGAVTGSYDGTEPLTVNIPSSGGGSGGGGAEFPNWRLIKTISFSADITSVDFDTDDNGNTFSLKEIMLAGTVPAYASGSYIYMKPVATGVQNSIWPTASKDVRWWAASVNGKLKTMLSVSNASVIWPVDKDPVCENDTISRLIIGSSNGFTADGTMYVYGR